MESISFETTDKRKASQLEVHEENSDINREQFTEEDFAVMMGNLSLLKNTEQLKNNPEKYLERSRDTVDQIKKYFQSKGAEFNENIMDLYKNYADLREPFIVRREDPLNIVSLVSGKDLELTFDPEVVGERGDKYVNSALWPHGAVNKTTGLANAFLEGRGAAGPIVMVMGVKQNQNSMEVVVPEGSMLDVGDLHRQSVRILSGKISKEDLTFVVLRIPKDFINSEDLTDIEKSNPNLKQVFRGFRFD